jgi:tyrosine-protein kinase Etk/Wzc
MTQTPPNGTDQRDTLIIKSEKDPHILDYFTLVAQYRKTVLFTSLAVGLLLLGYTYLMPQTFDAQVTVLPPEKQSSVGNLMSFLAGSSALDLMKSQENPALDLFRNVLESRMLSEEVQKDPRIHRYIAQFDSSKLGMSMFLLAATTSEALRNGMMTVTVSLPTHWTPQQAEIDSAKILSAYLANAYVRELDRFNRERLATTAHNTRVFVEGAYRERMHSLDSVYGAFQSFQEQNKTIALPEQLTQTVQAAAMLNAQVQQLEIQLGVEQQELNPNSNRIELLKGQLEGAQNSLKKYDNGTIGEYSLALKAVPELSRKFANYTREIKLLEQVSAYLRQQLEQERINEQRDLPSLQVLDNALAPTRKASPKRLVVLILGFLIGFALSLFYISIRTYFVKLRTNPEEHRKFLGFTRSFRMGNRSLATASSGNGDRAAATKINS